MSEQASTQLPLETVLEAWPLSPGAHGGERSLLELGFEIEAAQPFRRIQDRIPTRSRELAV
jgi:hypothetical protein